MSFAEAANCGAGESLYSFGFTFIQALEELPKGWTFVSELDAGFKVSEGQGQDSSAVAV